MANLRILSVAVVDSTTITATFTENVSPSIGPDNIVLESQLDSAPNPLVLDMSVVTNSLTITLQPLTPQVAYIITFQSVPGTVFKSLNGDSILFQDGITNKQLIIGPLEPDNPVQQFLQNYLKDNIYNVTDSTTIVNKVIQSLSNIISKALYDVRQVKNENYISFTVTDELKTRGAGPFDRLIEESAYEVTRVGRTITGTSATMNTPVPEFPDFPISLLANPIVENLTASSTDKVSTFNINDFTITVANQNVSKLTGLVFTYTDGYLPYTYNIPTLGYQILSSEYDQNYGFSNAILANNQFKISELILSDPLFSLQNLFQIQVSYEYRDLGRIIDPATVVVNTVISSIREVLPPIENVFNLAHAPIVDQSGNVVTSGGVQFIDPNAASPGAPHPAFVSEIPFSFSSLPFIIGQYSIDYATGTVYVYGSDASNSGTGPLPPLATYNYIYTYVANIDYTYDSDSGALVALPNGSLVNNAGIINFNYEQVLVPGIDYNAEVHIESLSERVQNRLLALNIIQTENSPITNVFRIYNETSGELYGITRWNSDKIYFTYVNAPNVDQQVSERASFNLVANEILFVNNQLTNTSHLTIFKFLLANNNVIAGTEDSIGSSINTSVSFSNTNVFKSEVWWDGSGIETETTNNNRLTAVGQYQIDYVNGVVYVAVGPSQSISVGTISYKNDSIVPQFPHVISVDDIYYRISFMTPKNKEFQYLNFADGSIVPASFDNSDEAFLNDTLTAPYEVFQGEVGVFIDDTFVPGVTNTVKFVRGLFEYDDLQNSTAPLNFVGATISSGNTIAISSISNQEFGVVFNDGYHYYVNIDLNLPYISPNFIFDISIVRNSDQAQLWDGYGTIVPGNPVKLVLSGANSPAVNDSVVINYSISINDLSRVIVDYNKGDYFVDYSYLADEIIISYEYGDNVLDFRQSTTVNTNDQYYVTYKVGALRDALLANFGTLINVPELDTLDVDLDRERYRDAVQGALETFVIGPTIAAMKTLVQAITHVEPEIIESAFQVWSLGSSFLNPNGFDTTGEFNLIPSKYGNGVVIDTPGQTITLPISSNLRLEQGSFQCWVTPEWDGIDNDAELTFSIMENGTPVLSNRIFVGAAEHHPVYDIANTFSVNKLSGTVGTPNLNKDGIFIYYDNDPSMLFKRWYCQVIDGYEDGYVDGYQVGSPEAFRNYTIQVKAKGLFYDVKSINPIQPPSLSITSGTNTATFRINSSLMIHEGIQFIADTEHYILDFGKAESQSRFSIYKDPSGYMNLRIHDDNKRMYIISADVSNWQAHQQHHVAASWAIGTKLNRDELHLFIDGFEVPNIIRYGNKVGPYLHEKFRTINPEEIAGKAPKSIVSSIDLVTAAGSNLVSSSINFSAYGISIGDIINIDEAGFDPDGYAITLVNGQTLTLNAPMPVTLTNGRFTVNRTALVVQTEINIYPNIAVSTITPLFTDNDLSIMDGYDVVTSGANFTSLGIQPGYLLRIDGYSIFEPHYVILSVSTSSLVLNDNMPEIATGLTYYIYPNTPVEIPGVRALRPSYTISEDGYYNSILTLNNNVSAHDLILITTLGLNHKRVKQNFYQWGDYSNIIKTRMAPPLDLNTTEIFHTLLTSHIINSGNSIVVGSGFTSNSIPISQPSVADNGRTLGVTISSGNIPNVDGYFTSPVTVTIDGYINTVPISEIITFNQVGTQNSVNKYGENFTAAEVYPITITVAGTVINTSKTFLTVQIQEAFPITQPENSLVYPIVRFSYPTRDGTTLTGAGGTTVTDPLGLFSDSDIGNYIYISSPIQAFGTFQIVSISPDRITATLNTNIAAFTDGYYQIINVSAYRSGFQNGYFVLEQPIVSNNSIQPYLLASGTYEFDFYTYLNIKFAPVRGNMYFGMSKFGDRLLSGVLDEVKITSTLLTDTRVGEIVAGKTESITKDFNSLKALGEDATTLVLAHFDTFPFTNDTDYYITTNKNFIQSSISVNDNFSQSLYVTDKPFVIENDGILHSKDQGTIEFWVNPLYDTFNDPNYRFYFDAAGIQIENVTSIDDVTVQVAGTIGQVLSVTRQVGDQKVDYFAGGKVEYNTSGAIAENATSTNANTVTVSRPVLQVITVKIVGDPTNTNYFINGGISTDGKTIYLDKTLPASILSLVVIYKPADGSSKTLNTQVIRLNKSLPNQNTPVTVTYIPSGLQGDRISIFKDPSGYLNFDVTASGTDYIIRSPIVWAKGTWHRVRATFTANGPKNSNTIRLFVDGYEQGNILFGTGLVFGDPLVFGSTFSGAGNGFPLTINFKDFLGELYIGSDYAREHGAFSLIDNFRISNLARPVFAPYGESVDVNWNSNISMAFPVTPDLYTTFLMDFDTLVTKNTDFITLIDKNSGIFDFTINIFDSFGIVKSSAKVQQILETLINVLKPANSRVYLKYIT